MSGRVIEIYTDGACKGNPGAGGWAAVLVCGTHERELSGGEVMTTNNRMEMMAVIRGLQAVRRRLPVRVFTDSQYVARGMREWLPEWERRGFRRADGKRVKNEDLWRELCGLARRFEPEWHWLRGHDGHPRNERADWLASRAAEEQQGAV